MRKSIRLAMLGAAVAGMLSPIIVNASASYGKCDYQLTFSDTFNGTSLDVTKWNPEYSSGNGGEQQYYSPGALSLQDGILYLTAEKEPANGYPYTSGIITTKDRFSQQYGFFITRVKLPKGQGFWPSFWLLPVKANYPTEIDMFEMLGKDPTTIYMSNHWKTAGTGHQKNIIAYQGPDFSEGFHTFSLLWTPEVLIWYVDGVEQYRTSEGIPNQPMFLLANLAVGGKWPGNPDATTPFPSSMQIDYIRVYTYQCDTNLMAVANPPELSFDERYTRAATFSHSHYQ